MSYKHLTINDRSKIEVLKNDRSKIEVLKNDRSKIEVLKSEGYSSRRIAKILGFHHSTISRELKRCKGKYKAINADKDNKYKQSFKGRKQKLQIILKTKSLIN